MSINLAALPQQERDHIQHDYQAALWAHQVKFGRMTRDEVHSAIVTSPASARDMLQKRFNYYLAIPAKR